jgi:hypothetical protein
MGKWSVFLSSALGGCEWSFSRPLCFSEERAPGTHQIGGWVGPRVGLVLWTSKNIPPLPGIQPRFLRCQASSLVTVLTELPENLNSEGKRILEALDRMPYTGDRPISKPRPTQITPNKIREDWQLTSMSQTGFEVTIKIFEVSKIAYALHCAAIAIGWCINTDCKLRHRTTCYNR